MLIKDDDAPLLALSADSGSNTVKSQVKDCISVLLNRVSDVSSFALMVMHFFSSIYMMQNVRFNSQSFMLCG